MSLLSCEARTNNILLLHEARRKFQIYFRTQHGENFNLAFVRSVVKILILLPSAEKNLIICLSCIARGTFSFCFRIKHGDNLDFAFARSAEKIFMLFPREARRKFSFCFEFAHSTETVLMLLSREARRIL